MAKIRGRKNVLKKFDAYEDTDVPAWLCDYEAKTVWGESRKLFDPVVEFYNRKSNPDFAQGRADWVEVFSNGTVQMRVRDTATFKAKFDFKKCSTTIGTKPTGMHCHL